MSDIFPRRDSFDEEDDNDEDDVDIIDNSVDEDEHESILLRRKLSRRKKRRALKYRETKESKEQRIYREEFFELLDEVSFLCILTF